jgi:hypothetical protein
MYLDVFCELQCLTEHSSVLQGMSLMKKWFRASDKRYLPQALQKFISYNFDSLSFLGIEASLVGNDQQCGLSFRTSSYVGSIPLRAPDTGLQIGDFVVSPRYQGKDRFEAYIEILDLLENDISPEFRDSLPLISGRNFRPPLYLEALKFLSSLELLTQHSWRKFDRQEHIQHELQGQINWRKYISREYKVENRLRFPIGKSLLSEYHLEYGQLRYVFDICSSELLSHRTPSKVKSSSLQRITRLEDKMYFHKPQRVSQISVHYYDNFYVRKCKEQANRILKREIVEGTAWRVDFSDAFEKFVQHIFREVAREKGGRLFPNHRFVASNSRLYAWQLHHIEPDAILALNDIQFFIDAKYKSNLFNKFDRGETLKEDHRHDLHQILGYSAFSLTKMKYAFLCYPSSTGEMSLTKYRDPYSDVSVNLYILGIPFLKDCIQAVKQLITNEIDKITRENIVIDFVPQKN